MSDFPPPTENGNWTCFFSWPQLSNGSSPSGLDGKESACNAEDPSSIPGSGRLPGEGNGNHYSLLAWRIPWTEEPSRLQSMVSQWVRHDWACMHAHNLAIEDSPNSLVPPPDQVKVLLTTPGKLSITSKGIVGEYPQQCLVRGSALFPCTAWESPPLQRETERYLCGWVSQVVQR